MAEESCGFTVGCVALVAIALDPRAGVERRPVIAMVLVCVGGVHRVRVARRNQRGAVDAARETVALRQHASQSLFEEGAIGSAHRTGADLLMLGTDQHA